MVFSRCSSLATPRCAEKSPSLPMGRQKTSRGLPGASGRGPRRPLSRDPVLDDAARPAAGHDPDPAVQPPFPAFAAARLRSGAPVDADAALSRWFTPAELDRGGPVVSYARRCLQQADRRSWAAALDAITRYDRAGRTACIRVPATLIAAELDQVSTPAAMSALASRLPRATLKILPGAERDCAVRPGGRGYRRGAGPSLAADPGSRRQVRRPHPGGRLARPVLMPNEQGSRGPACTDSRAGDKQRVAIACFVHPSCAGGSRGSRGSAVMVRASWVRDVTPVFRNTFRR